MSWVSTKRTSSSSHGKLTLPDEDSSSRSTALEASMLTITSLMRLNYHRLLHIVHSVVQRWVGWAMVFNATFNNLSVISWQSVLLVEETGLL
jgi:hypothetical protein